MRRLNLRPSKFGFLEYALFAGVPAILTGLVIAVALAGAKRETLQAVVIDERGIWTLRHSYQCDVLLQTGKGVLTAVLKGKCMGEYRRGDNVSVDILDGRWGIRLIASGTLRRT